MERRAAAIKSARAGLFREKIPDLENLLFSPARKWIESTGLSPYGLSVHVR